LTVEPHPDAVMAMRSGLALLPRFDVGAGLGQGGVFLTHVMGQRAAAADVFGFEHFAAQARQQARRRTVDARGQHLLRTPRQQRHAFAHGAVRR